MSDMQIIKLLIDRDEQVTRQFFFRDCRPLFVSIIRNVFSYEVDYDEFVNEFYLYLMENDAYRMRQFEGRSSVYQWLKIVAIRFFIAKKTRMIENESNEALLDKADCKESPYDGMRRMSLVDLNFLFRRMRNKRQVYVIRRIVLEDAEPEKVAKELSVTVDNLYNIKKRAIAALTEIALVEAK